MKRAFILAALAVATIAVPAPALGCAACFGQSDSPLAHGMNAGIFTLLAVIGVMLTMVASFFVFITRRARQVEAGTDAGDVSQSS
jgi:hypothetical protein